MSVLKPSEFERLITRAIEKALGKRRLNELGQDVVKALHDRVKAGFGSKNRRKQKLKSLSPSYIAQRRKQSLHSSTSPSKSNLTNTGEMLGSLQVDTSKSLTIRISTDAKNAKKAAFVSADRPFLELTDDEITKLVKALKSELTKALNAQFK